jgi:hypothetical protein
MELKNRDLFKSKNTPPCFQALTENASPCFQREYSPLLGTNEL